MGEGPSSDASSEAVTGAARAVTLVDTAVSPFCTMASDGVITWASASIEELLGWPASEFVGMNMGDLLAPESLARAVAMLGRFQESGQTSGEWVGSGILLDLRHADGRRVPCDVSVATPARTGLSDFALQLRRRGAAAHIHDALVHMAGDLPFGRVLDRIAVGLAAEISNARVEIHLGWDGTGFAISASSDGYSLLDDDVPTEWGHRPWRTALDTGRAVSFEDVDELPKSLGRWATQLGLTSCWVQPMATVADQEPAAVLMVWRSGAVDWTFFPSYETDRFVGLIAIAHQWYRGQQSLLFAASHDPLTGLANRRTLLDRVREPLVPGSGGTVLFCDIDDFKPVNDEYGHAMGDAVLQVVGERLRQVVRPTDLVARYGGDEFVVYCPGTTDPVLVDDLVDRLERALRTPIALGHLKVQVGLSVGRSAVTADADVDEVLARAARDMGEVKRQRKAVP